MRAARTSFPLLAIFTCSMLLFVGSPLGGCALFTGGTTADESEDKTPSRSGNRKRNRYGLTTAMVEKYGARVLQRPYAEVFEACKDALMAQGYTVAVAKPKRGLIISGRLRVGRETATLGVMLSDNEAKITETSVTYSRQYTLHLKTVAPGKTWVAAVPAVYAGDHDISGSVRWKLVGRFGERARWRQLFGKIRDLLPERKPTPGRPRARPVPPPAD